MRLESVLSLKQELKVELQSHYDTPGSALGLKTRFFAYQIEAPIVLPSRKLSVALGASPLPGGEFALAVRVQDPELTGGDEVRELVERARGEADVRVVGHLKKLGLAGGPLLPGSRIAHRPSGSWGSLGCCVTPADKSGGVYILSNNHVLANEGKASKGDEIVRSGAAPAEDTHIGALASWIRLRRLGVNLHDCAAAILDTGIPLAGFLADELADSLETVVDVRKAGAATGITTGRVTAFDVDGLIFKYGIGDLRFDGQIEISSIDEQPFALPGDSGSLVHDALTGHAVGLLFGGNASDDPAVHPVAYASPMKPILQALRMELFRG